MAVDGLAMVTCANLIRVVEVDCAIGRAGYDVSCAGRIAVDDVSGLIGNDVGVYCSCRHSVEVETLSVLILHGGILAL